MKYIALALTHLKEELATAAKMLQDHSRPVDVYLPQTLIPDIANTITLQPAWEVNEVIESVLITGPVATNVVVQLGDRVWPLVIGVSGFINLSNLHLRLGRSDVRQLTATVAGDYSFELMGFADSRSV